MMNSKLFLRIFLFSIPFRTSKAYSNFSMNFPFLFCINRISLRSSDFTSVPNTKDHKDGLKNWNGAGRGLGGCSRGIEKENKKRVSHLQSSARKRKGKGKKIGRKTLIDISSKI